MGAGEGIGALGVKRCGSDRDTALCARIILGRKLIIWTVSNKKNKCTVWLQHAVDINVALSESFICTQVLAQYSIG